MKFTRVFLIVIICSFFSVLNAQEYSVEEKRFIIYKVTPQKGKLKLYWKNKKGETFNSINNLKESIESDGEKLIFAMNGGMYNKDSSPQGLFIEKGKTVSKLETRESGYGNFYLQPNGIFYLTKDNNAVVESTSDFNLKSNINYATQSGPMLLIKGNYHPKIRKGSSNLHIRNGVGILPNGEIIFVMSKEKVNFYDLATLFKQKGCLNALYLDGFVSRTYLPSKKWIQLDGNFGVIIGEVE